METQSPITDQIFAVQCRALADSVRRDQMRLNGPLVVSGDAKAATLVLIEELRRMSDLVHARAGISTARAI